MKIQKSEITAQDRIILAMKANREPKLEDIQTIIDAQAGIREAAEKVSRSISIYDSSRKNSLTIDTLDNINSISERLIQLLELSVPDTLQGLDKLAAVIVKLKNLDEHYFDSRDHKYHEEFEELKISLQILISDLKE